MGAGRVLNCWTVLPRPPEPSSALTRTVYASPAPSGVLERHTRSSADTAPAIRWPSAAVTVTSVSVPLAAVTTSGRVGSTGAFPTGLTLTRAAASTDDSCPGRAPLPPPPHPQSVSSAADATRARALIRVSFQD